MPKVGDRVRIISMEGEPSYSGKEGTVEFIDDMGQIHGTWGGCALIPGADDFEVVQACALCGRPIRGHGHNGSPLTDGRVCEECNRTKVIPERLKSI